VEKIAQLKELYGYDDDRENVVALLYDRDSALYQANTFHAQRERLLSSDASSGDRWTNLQKIDGLIFRRATFT
jgi:hypothetical protein